MLRWISCWFECEWPAQVILQANTVGFCLQVSFPYREWLILISSCIQPQASFTETAPWNLSKKNVWLCGACWCGACSKSWAKEFARKIHQLLQFWIFVLKCHFVHAVVVQVLEIYCEFGASHTAMSTIALWSPYSPEPRRLDGLKRIEVLTTSPWFCELFDFASCIILRWFGEMFKPSFIPTLGLGPRRGKKPLKSHGADWNMLSLRLGHRRKETRPCGLNDETHRCFQNDDPTCFFFWKNSRDGTENHESREPSWI